MSPVLLQQGQCDKPHHCTVCTASERTLVVTTSNKRAPYQLVHEEPARNQPCEQVLGVRITSALGKVVHTAALTLACSKLPSWCSALAVISSAAPGVFASEFVHEESELTTTQDLAQDRFEAERQMFIQEIASLKRAYVEVRTQLDQCKASIPTADKSPLDLAHVQKNMLLDRPSPILSGPRHEPSTDPSVRSGACTYLRRGRQTCMCTCTRVCARWGRAVGQARMCAHV